MNFYMVIVRIMDGLGNQMFQYAFVQYLKKNNINVKVDIKCNMHNGFELERIFRLHFDKATKFECAKFGVYPENFFGRVIRKLVPISKIYTPGAEKSIIYEPHIKMLDNIYLSGYWQSYKYLIDNRQIIDSIYRFPIIKDLNLKKISDIITNTNSVSIHVRRGDYINDKNLGNIVGLNYYNKAIAFIKSIIPDAKLFCFSNDINWCKEAFQDANITFISGNYEENSYIDMQLMSLCKHNIIANSSFSWWGAWLNNNPNKVVIAPSKWNAVQDNVDDLIPSSWKKIPV